jgi:hypothetical protein
MSPTTQDARNILVKSEVIPARKSDGGNGEGRGRREGRFRGRRTPSRLFDLERRPCLRLEHFTRVPDEKAEQDAPSRRMYENGQSRAAFAGA